MTIEQWAVLIAASGAVGVYAWRLNDMTWRTHLARCVATQLSGAVAAAAVIYLNAERTPIEILGAVCCLIWAHIAATGERWQDGPPPETESRPMPLDGVRQ